MKVTARPPAITKISVASHVPKRSRKFCTFIGLTMPESASPAPKSMPERIAASRCIISASHHVADDVDGDDRHRHEYGRGHDAAFGETRDPADAMARGASPA